MSPPPPPAPAPSAVLVRPPEGLARGRYPVPGWVVLATALTLVVGALAFTMLRRRRLRASGDAAPPLAPRSDR